MKVKELKELLANVDDELEIVGYENGMEQTGLLPVSKYGMKVITGKTVKKETWDRFDGIDYTYEAFEPEKKVKKVKKEMSEETYKAMLKWVKEQPDDITLDFGNSLFHFAKALIKKLEENGIEP